MSTIRFIMRRIGLRRYLYKAGEDCEAKLDHGVYGVSSVGFGEELSKNPDMKRLVQSAFILLLGTGLLSCASQRRAPITAPQKIEVHGHRGAAASMPENTMAAFRYAAEIGVDVIELDTSVTKDGHLVVKHDQEITDRVCTRLDGAKIEKPIPIRMLTLEQVKGFECGSIANPKFPKRKNVPGEKIPTLREVFTWANESGNQHLKFNIETKTVPNLPYSPSADVFAKTMLELVDEFKMRDRVIIQSFDHRTLQEVKNIAPQVQTAALIYWSRPNFVEMLKSSKADILSPMFLWADKGDIEKLHAAGHKVVPWTANEERVWQQLVAIGVDGIISDDPKALIEFLKKQGRR